MGCCISKCRPKNKKHSLEESNVIQDKLVISQLPQKTPKITPSNKISPIISPPSPTAASSSSSSVSSFSCTNYTNTTISSSSSSISSGSSLVLSSRDRSFSNEFLWSRVKENPHIIRINSIKQYSHNLQAQKQPIQPRLNASTPQKRIRCNSPSSLNRQKSFRRELERVNSSYSSRSFRSPSHSRRFSNGDKLCLRKENLNPCLVKSSQNFRSCLRNVNRETCIHRISSKIDEVAVEEALAQDSDSSSVPMEDIDNHLISLDCFIFL